MAVVIRVLQFLLVLLAAVIAVAFVMALGSSGTGPVEKGALFVMASLCLWGALSVPRLAARLQARRHLT